MRRHTLGLHLFHRDLRLSDNTGLLQALAECERVIPVFILDPRQASPKRNPYFSERAFSFMRNALHELDDELRTHGSRLYVFEGETSRVIERLIRQDGVSAVYGNANYTPFARARDEALRSMCDRHRVPFIATDDVALSPITEIATQGGKPYSVFTPFMRAAMKHTVHAPRENTHANYYREALGTPTIGLDGVSVAGRTKGRATPLPHLTPPSPEGRRSATEILRDASFIARYKHGRDLPAEHGTSRLSPHHKFGTVSIRETYAAVRKRHGEGAQQFIAELYWRDFYYHIAHHFPRVFGESFLLWGDRIAWRNAPEDLAAWQRGETGIPIVDAGMRELNTTGWMHNRVRMIVASFLTKNLLIDWREGERYFATRLVDYDPAVNNGSWQWAASVGADPRPLRIFNPYTQAQKYDPEATYIKRHVPELATLPSHLLTDGKERDFSTLVPAYPAPLISCRETYHRAREEYARAKRAS